MLSSVMSAFLLYKKRVGTALVRRTTAFTDFGHKATRIFRRPDLSAAFGRGKYGMLVSVWKGYFLYVI